MALTEITAVALNTNLGRYVMPLLKFSETNMASGASAAIAAGDSIATSLLGYITDNSQYRSVIAQLSTSYQDAITIYGSNNNYKIQLSATGNSSTKTISGRLFEWTPPGSSSPLANTTYLNWQNTIYGSTRFTITFPVFIQGTDGKTYLSYMQILYAWSSPIQTLSISDPEAGVIGSLVVDYSSSDSRYLSPISGWDFEKNASICSDILSNPYTPPPTDPYTPGGESDSGGGTGNFDGTSVDVDFASLPTLSAVDTGFITLYNPTLTQLQSLASYMWSGLFDIDTLKKLFADPMQAILGLSIVPGPVPSGATQNVKIGNIDSGVSMTKAATQYIDIDCGTLNVEEFWGAYLDYEPYTKAEIYLPFIGVHQIAIDDIMNKSVHIKYHIDLLSGGCACEIKCGGSVLYTFVGSCAVSIPVTGSDWTNSINGVLSVAASIGTMVATGGAASPAAAGSIASSVVNSLKPSIEKSGSIAGAGGLLAGKVPVLILTRPRQALPSKQNTFTGYPAFITRSLGALSGYTEVHSILLSGIDGTESEINEIEELLKGGVIL